MKAFRILLPVFLSFTFISSPLSALAEDESSPVKTAGEEASPPEDSVDTLENGTLYSNLIHHRRPPRDISKTWKEKRKRSPVENLSASFFSNFRSRYVSHALADSHGWVWQPSATVEWYGLGFNVWGNFVLEDRADRGTFNEVDLTLYYDIKVHNFTIHPYFVAFLYPTHNKLSLDFSSATDLLPSLHLAYSVSLLDFFADVQIYAHPRPGAVRMETGLGLTHPLPLKFGIETSGLVGLGSAKYNRAVFNIPDTAFTYFTYSLAFPWNPVKGFVVKPNVYVSTFFSQRFRDATPFPVQLWGGVDFAYHL